MAFSFRVPAFAACTLLLAACAGSHGSGGFAPAALPQSDEAVFAPDGTTPTVAMKYSIKIPPVKTPASDALRHEQFVSASTQSIAFAVYKPGKTHSAKNLLFTQVVALNPGAKGCTKARARTCTGTLNLPPPAVDIVATTYDKKPAAKKIPPKAQKLGIATIANLAVKKNTKIPFTLGGIPTSFTMTIAGATPVSGVPTSTVYGMSQSTTAIALDALDADGNVIVTDGYVNAAGKSTGIALGVTSSHTGCGTNQVVDGTTAGSSIVVSAPSDTVHFGYAAKSIASPFSTAGYCNFTVTAKFGTTKSSGLFVLDGPQLNEYPIGLAAQPNSIAVGPDGNIWFADYNGYVGTINVSTKAITEYALSTPVGIVSSGGNLWVDTANTLVQVQSNGSMSSVPMTNTGYPSDQLAVDASGNFWFTESGALKVAKVTTTGATTEFPVAGATPYPLGMATGSDNNMWFTACGASQLGRITPNVPNTQTLYAVPPVSAGVVSPYMMAGGPDGKLWFTSFGAGIVARVPLPTGASISPTYFQMPANNPNGRAAMYGIAAGPNGDMWATDLADNTLDRIPLTASDASQITAVKVTESPYWAVKGPDGAIWFTERLQVSGNRNGMIGRIVP